jgi:hypothetical protein
VGRGTRRGGRSWRRRPCGWPRGALADTLSSGGASGGLPRSEQRVNAAVPVLVSVGVPGWEAAGGPPVHARPPSTGCPGGERGHGVQGHLGARDLGKERPRGAPGGSDAEGGRRRGGGTPARARRVVRARAPKMCRPALFEIRFLQKIE